MRGSMMAIAMVLVMAACSNGQSPAGPLVGPGPSDLLALYQGSEAGPAGLVQVEVRIQGQAEEPGAIFAGQALVQLSVDGRRLQTSEPSRFRINGVETDLLGMPDPDVIEVYAGLGGDQDWITALRTR